MAVLRRRKCRNLRRDRRPTDGATKTLQKFSISDAKFERSRGQSAEAYARNVADQRQGGPVNVGYRRYGANVSIEEHIVVDDVMIVLKGRISVDSDAGTATAGLGEIIYMQKESKVTIRSHDEGADTAYATYPHWRLIGGRYPAPGSFTFLVYLVPYTVYDPSSQPGPWLLSVMRSPVALPPHLNREQRHEKAASFQTNFQSF